MAEVKEYKITQIEGKITWKVEELWEGGTERGPYGTMEAAMHAEKLAAEQNGFADKLVLAGTEGGGIDPKEAFEKSEDGMWVCTKACSITMANKEIVFTPGHSFNKDESYMGVDVVGWLEENIKA